MILSQAEIAHLLAPYLHQPLADDVLDRLSSYLDLLVFWNGKVNLTSVRDPQQIVQRHFGESIFLAQKLPACTSVLDFGSGGGFPGVPLQIVRSDLQVMLAESQGKKAAFLAEIIRTLHLTAQLWPKRVEDLPLETTFDMITMRAVDMSSAMLPVAVARLRPAGWLAVFQPSNAGATLEHGSWQSVTKTAIPLSRGVILLAQAV